MQKIIVDTNVLISGLISKSFPYDIINDIIFEAKATVYVSDSIFDEYISVLNREKFSKFPGFKENAAIVLRRIKQIAVKINPDKYKKTETR